MKIITTCLLLIIPVFSWAECPVDKNETQRINSVDKIKIIRASYETNWTKPESVNCYYRLLLLESKLAYIKDDTTSLEKSSKKMLELDPSDSWGIFFLRQALISQGKKPHGEISINRIPYGRIDNAFVKKLAKKIENKS